ncbi:MAG TPA: hypothetical protein VG294_03625 [Solirubrobacteraceae bacterium]|jgi:hypothetical protein|nr:hypothetical protein [Solirubrobacteraceae bacterium]
MPVDQKLEYGVRAALRRTDTTAAARRKAALVSVSVNELEDVAQRLQLLGWSWAPRELRQIADALKSEKGVTW